jgi:hypothetical protein
MLDAVERGAIDFDELVPECERSWQYFADNPYKLCRFDAADDPYRDPSALGWIWLAHNDTSKICSRATYDVFVPGWMWDECADADAARAAIRARLAS